MRRNAINTGWIEIFKLTNELRASTTVLADDTVLQFPVTAGIYAFELHVATFAGAGAYKYALVAPTAGAPIPRAIYRQHGSTSLAVAHAVSGGPPGSTSITGGGVHGFIHLIGNLELGAAGTVAFQFAQNTLNADPSYSVQGSWMRYIKIT